MKRFPVVFIAVLLLTLFLVGCSNVPAPAAAAPDDQVALDVAVEATLTAIAESDPEESEGSVQLANPTNAPASASTPDASQQDAAPSIVLPPTVPDFQPLARPDASKGDPEAPVVIYEWSDYT